MHQDSAQSQPDYGEAPSRLDELTGQLDALLAILAGLRSAQQQRQERLRTAAHDLRSHVGIVSSAAQLLIQTTSEAQRSQLSDLLVRNARQLSERLSQFLEEFQEDAASPTSAPAPFDAGRLLHNLGRQFLPRAQEHSLSFTADGPDSLSVTGDPEQLGLLVRTLMSTALRGRPGGQVCLSWGEASGARRWWLQVSATCPDLPAQFPAENVDLKVARELAWAMGGAWEKTGENVKIFFRP